MPSYALPHSQVSASDVGMCLCKVYFCHTDSIQDNKQNVSLTVDKCFAYSNFAVILRLIICLVFFFQPPVAQRALKKVKY